MTGEGRFFLRLLALFDSDACAILDFVRPGLSILCAVHSKNKTKYVVVLTERQALLPSSQAESIKRIKR